MEGHENTNLHVNNTHRATDACLFSYFSGAVLSLTMGEDGESCYSGGLDGAIRCWKMPDLNVDPYDNYGKSLCELIEIFFCFVFHAF